LPQCPQKRNVTATSDPQNGQPWGSAAPHCTQKRMLAGLSNWQLEHLIGVPQSAAPEESGHTCEASEATEQYHWLYLGLYRTRFPDAESDTVASERADEDDGFGEPR
jgi:hypothetical protein